MFFSNLLAEGELATQITLMDLLAQLENYRSRLAGAALGLLAENRNILSSLVAALRYASPERRIHSERQRVDELARRTQSSVLHQVQLQSAHVRGMDRRLEALNPLAVLARGYAVVTRKEDGSVVFRVDQAGEEMSVRVSDGEFEVKNSHPR